MFSKSECLQRFFPIYYQFLLADTTRSSLVWSWQWPRKSTWLQLSSRISTSPSEKWRRTSASQKRRCTLTTRCTGTYWSNGRREMEARTTCNREGRVSFLNFFFINYRSVSKVFGILLRKVIATCISPWGSCKMKSSSEFCVTHIRKWSRTWSNRSRPCPSLTQPASYFGLQTCLNEKVQKSTNEESQVLNKFDRIFVYLRDKSNTCNNVQLRALLHHYQSACYNMCTVG